MSPAPSDTRSDASRRVIAEFAVPSEPGGERGVAERVAGALSGAGLSPRRRERLRTAVAETTMNAIEHGNGFDPGKLARVEVSLSGREVFVRVTDEGPGPTGPERAAPDLAAKLEGEQTPRGWGLFLIENMVDAMNVTGDESHHTVELVFRRDERDDGERDDGITERGGGA